MIDMQYTICIEPGVIGLTLLALCLSSSLPIQLLQPLNTIPIPIFSPFTHIYWHTL